MNPRKRRQGTNNLPKVQGGWIKPAGDRLAKAKQNRRPWRATRKAAAPAGRPASVSRFSAKDEQQMETGAAFPPARAKGDPSRNRRERQGSRTRGQALGRGPGPFSPAAALHSNLSVLASDHHAFPISTSLLTAES